MSIMSTIPNDAIQLFSNGIHIFIHSCMHHALQLFGMHGHHQQTSASVCKYPFSIMTIQVHWSYQQSGWAWLDVFDRAQIQQID